MSHYSFLKCFATVLLSSITLVMTMCTPSPPPAAPPSLPAEAAPPTEAAAPAVVPEPVLGAIEGVIYRFTNQMDASEPLSRATITLHNAGQTVRTDDDGRYRVENLASGPEFMLVSAPNLVTEQRTLFIEAGVVAIVDITLTDLALIPHCTGTTEIRGQVRIGTEPAAGANVVSWPGEYETTTEADGSYVVVSLCDADFILVELGDRRGFIEVTGDPAEQRYDILLVGP